MDLSRLVPLLRDLQIASFLTGMKTRHGIVSFADTPYDRMIEALKKILNLDDIEQLVQIYEAEAFDRIQELDYAVRQTVERGLTVGNVDAIPSTVINQTKTVFRTASMMAYNAANYVVDQDPAVQEILWGYEYQTAGDERVRPEHVAMDGVTRPKDDPIWTVWWPPNGWNCRCIVTALFEPTEPTDPQPMEDGSIPTPDPGFAFNPALPLGVI